MNPNIYLLQRPQTQQKKRRCSQESITQSEISSSQNRRSLLYFNKETQNCFEQYKSSKKALSLRIKSEGNDSSRNSLENFPKKFQEVTTKRDSQEFLQKNEQEWQRKSNSRLSENAPDLEIKPQSQINFTKYLLDSRKNASNEEISLAFNGIKDMNNKEQVSLALFKIKEVKGRTKLIQKILNRRQQIKQAKEMQKINNMAPLFEKIKSKFLSVVREAQAAKDSTAFDYLQKNEAEGEEKNNVNNESDQKNEQNQTEPSLEGTLQLKSGINKNNMAINIFASHDIREETAQVEEQNTDRPFKLLKYLQRDQLLLQEEKKQNNGFLGLKSIHPSNASLKTQPQLKNIKPTIKQQAVLTPMIQTEEPKIVVSNKEQPALSKTSMIFRTRATGSAGSLQHLKVIAGLTEDEDDMNDQTLKYHKPSMSQMSLPTKQNLQNKRMSYLQQFISECENKISPLKEQRNQPTCKEQNEKESISTSANNNNNKNNNNESKQQSLSSISNLESEEQSLSSFRNNLKRKKSVQLNCQNELYAKTDILKKQYNHPIQELTQKRVKIPKGERFYLKTRFLAHPLPASLLLPRSISSSKSSYKDNKNFTSSLQIFF